ncbi:hypothetical protein KAI87_15320, partial [Myxococcota bacterium]|nr:hypothetical protein [Myxococcota bacterium]
MTNLTALFSVFALLILGACQSPPQAPAQDPTPQVEDKKTATPAPAAIDSGLSANATIEMVGRYQSKTLGGAETIDIKSGSPRAVLCDSVRGAVEIIDISNPAIPKFVVNHSLNLADGEDATSAAVHPVFDYFLVSIQAAGTHKRGRI